MTDRQQAGQQSEPEPLILESKLAMREAVTARLKGLAAADRALASAYARERLAEQALWQNAGSVLFFAPLPGELDVWPLVRVALQAGKSVALPLFDRRLEHYTACRIENPETDLHIGHFGIREPNTYCSRVTSERLDLILVPGVAFDAQGHRLGRGKAYYDRLLAVMGGPRCGVAFDEQVVPEVPVEAHDVRMDYLVTPTRWLDLRR